MKAFTCAHCGLLLEIDDDYSVETVVCKRCGRLVSIPSLAPGDSRTVASLKALKRVTWVFGLLVVVLPLLLVFLGSWWRGNWSKYEFRPKSRPARSGPAAMPAAPPASPVPRKLPPRARPTSAAPSTATQPRGRLRPTRPGARVTPAPVPQSDAGPDETPPEPDPSRALVWVGATGNTYHAEGCPRLGEDGDLVTLEEARAQGRNACTRCYGTELTTR